MSIEGKLIGSCLSDLELTILDFDAHFSDILQREVRELNGLNVLELTHPLDRTVNQSKLSRLRQEGEPFTITKRYLLPGGSVQWVRNHVSRPLGRFAHLGVVATIEAIDPPNQAPERPLIDIAHSLVRRRRIRPAFFADRLFNEAAVDVLLDLYISEHASGLVRTYRACMASWLPPTTALRQLDQLESRGLIARERNPNDKRSTLVALTDLGRATICDFLGAVHRADTA